MKVSTTALAAVLVLSCFSASAACGQSAQPSNARNNGQQQAQPAAPRLRFSPAEQRALQPLDRAYQAARQAVTAHTTPDFAAVRALLPAAQAAATSNDAKYYVAEVVLFVAANGGTQAEQQAAIEAVLASPLATAEERTRLTGVREAFIANQAAAAFNAQDFATAERLFRQLSEAHPENETYRNNLAVVQSRLGNSAPMREAVLARIRTAEAAGGAATAEDYQRAVALASQAHDNAQAIQWATRRAQFYSTASNWTDAVLVYRQFGNPTDPQMLDLLRLARVSGGLGGNDYAAFGQLLVQAGLPGEAKTVLEEGLQQNMTASAQTSARQLLQQATARAAEDRTALAAQITQARAGGTATLARGVGDALYGYGRYAEAAEMFRLAMTRSGADTSQLNLRLGEALLMAGQRAEAEAAFRAVTGSNAGLAQLWLAWLGRRTG
jgi:hypothetical protein